MMISREDFQEILNNLRTHFPGAFPKKGFRIFKKGIDLDICKSQKLQISRTKLRTILKIYALNPLYIKEHVAGANRYDLEGNVVATVTEEEYAQKQEINKERLKRKKLLKQKMSENESKPQDDKKQED